MWRSKIWILLKCISSELCSNPAALILLNLLFYPILLIQNERGVGGFYGFMDTGQALREIYTV